MGEGWISEIERGSAVDGPGLRTVVFLKGCPLRCAWCHNPETIASQPEMTWNARLCVGCGACAVVCPNAALRMEADGLRITPERCRACGRCAEACPSRARRRVGRALSPEAALAVVERDAAYYDKTGGGVTVSGGEPALQAGFTREFLALCRRRGIHTALDTSGAVPQAVLAELAAAADLVLYDLKRVDAEGLRACTGASADLVLGNLEALDRLGVALWIRTPVIPGYTDDEANIARCAQVAARLKHVRRYDLLPYNPLAEHKYRLLGRAYALAKASPPTPERMAALKRCAEAQGVENVVC